MNDLIQILKYSTIDEDFHILIELHKTISADSKLFNRLIYFDKNYPQYFQRIISDNEHNMVTVLKLNNTVVGFIHFKFIEKTVFLNNICISSGLQGRGLGRRFLKESLDMVCIKEMVFFSLDVYKSNAKASSWYKNLGLKSETETEWKQIFLKKDNNLLSANSLCRGIDSNGFTGLYQGTRKIATIVNVDTLILHTLDYIYSDLFTHFVVITPHDTSALSREDYNFIELEVSVRMIGMLNDIIKNINNA